MKKKGMELSLNTIVIAIIVLVVLVMVVLIFTGKLGELIPIFGSFTNCQAKGGDCVNDPKNCVGQAVKGFGGCPKTKGGNDEWCCLPEKSFLGKTTEQAAK